MSWGIIFSVGVNILTHQFQFWEYTLEIIKAIVDVNTSIIYNQREKTEKKIEVQLIGLTV